jgi:hypothetical protein
VRCQRVEVLSQQTLVSRPRSVSIGGTPTDRIRSGRV